MTSNVNVAISNMEAERANRARERENLRHNMAVEFETNRSNLEAERHNRNVLVESRRHSMATEFQAMRDLTERNRAARATEQLRAGELAESRRHNSRQEAITHSYNIGQLSARERERIEAKRHNIAGELLTSRSHDIKDFEVRGNLTARQAEHEASVLLKQQELGIREKDIYYQHADRLGRLEVDSYKAKTDRLGTILTPLTSLLNATSKK